MMHQFVFSYHIQSLGTAAGGGEVNTRVQRSAATTLNGCPLPAPQSMYLALDDATFAKQHGSRVCVTMRIC